MLIHHPSPTPDTPRRRRFRLQFGGVLRVRRAGEKETLILGLLCTLDMLTTLFWVVFGHAREANPLLAWTFLHHPVAFVVVKCLTCLPALIMAPYLAQRYRTFTIWLLRAIIALYIGLYFRHAEF